MNTTSSFPAADACIRQVHQTTGILVPTITGPSNAAPARAARYTAIALIYQTTDIPVDDIGGCFRRDRNAVHYALDRVRDRLVSDAGFVRQYTGLIGKRPILRQLPAPRSKCGVKKLRATRAGINAGGGTFVHVTTHGALHQLGPKALDRKLEEAKEQLSYWTAAKVRAIREEDRTNAAARVLLWTGEVKACERRAQELAPAATL
jgi:hypothetical protein